MIGATAEMRAHPMNLDGKVAIVTGGNRGIGQAIAAGLAAAGCGVAILARDPARNAQAVAAIVTHGGAAIAETCDVTDSAALDRAMSATVERFGRLDGAFINAGIGGGGRTPFVEQTDEAWARMIEVNLMGARRTAQVALRHMVAAGNGGRIVFTASVAPRFGTAFNQHYAASKAGMIALARGIAVEFGRHAITSNAILPGYTETEMIDDLTANQRFHDAMAMRLPLRRLGRAEDLAGIAIYLMSDMSAYHNGDVLTVDGGFSIS